MMRKLSIPYGKEEIQFSIPEQNFSEYLEPHNPGVPDDDWTETKRALDNPIGSPKIEAIVKPNQKVAILCEDITRYAQTDVILAELVDRLNKSDIPDSRIKIVMALGSHRPMTDAEKIVKVGRALFERIEVVNSENKDKNKMVDMGLAPGNVRVWLDPTVYASDIKIGVGSIEPHTAAGFTGGGKIIYPGVVGEDTVANFHLISASLGNLTGEADNRARMTMEAWVDTVGLDYIVNAVVTPKNKIYKVVAGHYINAHREGVKFAKEVWGIKAKQKMDIAIVSSHPADLDLWQAGKGIVNCEKVIPDDGLLILVTPCPEGGGPHPEYIGYIGSDDPLQLLKNAREGGIAMDMVLPLAVGAAVARIRKRINIAVISEGLQKAELEQSGLMAFNTINEALKFGLKKYGTNAKIAVIPMGGGSYIYN